MKKILFSIFLCIALIAFIAVPVVAGSGSSGKSNAGNVYLFEKDPTTWEIVPGAWGKYNYQLVDTTISGVFNGHGLVVGAEYALVEYNNWPNITIIGTGTTKNGGNVNISGSADLGEPIQWDGDYVGHPAGYKIWLVPTEDITGNSLNKWNPGVILFEQDLVYPNLNPVDPPVPQ